MDLTNLNLNKDRTKMRRKPPVDLSTMVYGKIPPQAKELEEAVLGAIMLEKSAFDTVVEILKPECFYLEGHQRIYRSMQSLAQKSQPIDIFTVVEELKTRQELDIVGGAYYVTKLTNSVVSSAHIETHSRIILQKFIQRELIRISGEIIGDAYEDSTDVFDLLDDAESKLFEITNNHLRKNFDSIDNVLVKTIARIEDLRHKQDQITGVPSGFPKLDKITYGWQPTDLIILAARPAVGKTAFALNLARNAALNTAKPTPVAFFSLEMSSAQLVQRILSAESEIFMEKIARGRLEEHEMKQLYKKGIDRLAKAPIFIDDTPALNIFELRAKCRRLKNKHNVGFIIIDYLQLMSGAGDSKNGNREQEISQFPSSPSPSSAAPWNRERKAKRSRSSVTCGNPAQSNRTRTWSCSSIAPNTTELPPTKMGKTTKARPTSRSLNTVTVSSIQSSCGRSCISRNLRNTGKTISAASACHRAATGNPFRATTAMATARGFISRPAAG
jgi:replicative DNA helicase